jgi:hypothetical protein
MITQTLQSGNRGHGHRSGCFERDAGRLQSQRGFGNSDIFGKAPQAASGDIAKYIVPDFILTDAFADCFNSPGDIGTEDLPFGYDPHLY